MKRRRLQKIETHATLLFRKDGWCLHRWRGWFPDFSRDKGAFYTEYRLRIGPAFLVLQTYR